MLILHGINRKCGKKTEMLRPVMVIENIYEKAELGSRQSKVISL
jgi:hypothetical protein